MTLLETQVNHRVNPTSNAIEESVDLAHEIYNCVFRKVPERIAQKLAYPDSRPGTRVIGACARAPSWGSSVLTRAY
jgi:hypothetical protein